VIIDWHTHVYPPTEAAKPVWQGRCPMTIDNVLTAQERAGIDASMISNAMHAIRRASPSDALAFIGESNRHLAELQDRHSGRIYGFASAIPGGGDEHLRELERAVARDGLKGVLINSSHQGAYPDDDDARPFFELVTKLDIPVMLHPPPIGFGEERMRQFRLASSVGRPFDNCLALARLILYGVLDEFPQLELVASHLGGGICEMLGRLDYNYELQAQGFYTRDEDREPMRISRPPSHYLKSIYFDSVSYHLPALKCALDTIGADRMLFGTDAPPLTPLKQRGLDLIDGLDLGTDAKAKVLGGNARRLLRLQ
jgi:predicted TIM-barrel fold metal-dependent hydrolase